MSDNTKNVLALLFGVLAIAMSLFTMCSTCRAESVRPCDSGWTYPIGMVYRHGGCPDSAVAITTVAEKRGWLLKIDSLRSELSRVKATLDSLVRALTPDPDTTKPYRGNQNFITPNNEPKFVPLRYDPYLDTLIPRPKTVDSLRLLIEWLEYCRVKMYWRDSIPIEMLDTTGNGPRDGLVPALPAELGGGK